MKYSLFLESSRSIAKNLNLYTYITLKMLDDDLYPHANKLGRRIGRSIVKKKWELTVKQYKAGKGTVKLGMYLHIPFCTSKCLYCFCDSFVPKNRQTVSQYVQLLKKELACFSPVFKGAKLTSLYFGGGTPAILDAGELDDLFAYIYANYHFTHDAPIIFEATPSTLTEEKIKILADNGVSRLTIGVQTMDKRLLRDFGRQASNRNFVLMFELSKKLGIPCINVDLMAGLEGQTVDSFMDGLKKVVEIGADMVHINAFNPLPHTLFSRAGRKLSSEAIKNRDVMIEKGREYLARHDYTGTAHDEMGKSVDARNMQEADLRQQNASVLGLGYGAESHAFGHLWYQHPHSITSHPLDLTKIPPCIGVKSSRKKEMVKFMVNNLRSGFQRNSFREIFGREVEDVFGRELRDLEAMGKLRLTQQQVNASIENYKEYIVLCKHFYSRDTIKNIMESQTDKFNPDEDYGRQLETFLSEAD